MGKQTYYEFFGLKNFESDPLVLKKAYRSMALKYHPDRNADKVEAERMMKQVNEVWRILRNHREEYDRHLKRKQGSSDHMSDAFRYTKQNWTNTKGKKNPFSEWSFSFDEAEEVDPDIFNKMYEEMMQRNWGGHYKADPNKYDREQAEKKQREKERQKRQEEHDLQEQKKRFEFFSRMTDDEYTEAKSWTEYRRNNGDIVIGLAGEDLQPGDLVIRSADGKFYKAKQKE